MVTGPTRIDSAVGTLRLEQPAQPNALGCDFVFRRDELEHEERLARREDLLSAGSTDAELPAMVLRGETRLTQVIGGCSCTWAMLQCGVAGSIQE